MPSVTRAIVLLGLIGVGVSACGSPPPEEVAVPPVTEVPAPEPVVAETLTEAEVLRPDIYDETDMGLWDGRPSIGGLWIAHPTVSQAERVRVTNLANNRTITGALFARDPSIPGPPFLMSGEAAATLGAEPGVPVQLNVVALRREIIEPGGVSSAALDGMVAAPAISEVQTTTPDTVVAVAPVTAPQTAPAPVQAASTLDRPFIQVGAFAVQGNAQRLTEQLRQRGYSVQTAPLQGRTRTLTRVVVGPAATSAERDGLLQRLRADGFTDVLITDL